MNSEKKRIVIRIIMIVLFAVMISIMAVKLLLGNYSLESIIPQDSYTVSTHMSFTGDGSDVIVRTFLPKSNDRQKIINNTIFTEGLNFKKESTPLFDRGSWSQFNAEGNFEIEIQFEASIRAISYNIDPSLEIPETSPAQLAPFLDESNVVQVSNPDILAKARELTGTDRSYLGAVRKLFDYVYNLGSKPFKGTTDALTALRLGEASCNGKSRLFIAMTRGLGIPSRLVGGLILNTGSKRTSHQWAELFIGGTWVPFDTLNGHFARLPDNYLQLYLGDEALFHHSKNIGFDYRFDIRKKLVTNSRLTSYLDGQFFNLYNIVNGLLQGGFSLTILQFLLVIPFGVLFVVLFRNVIGLNTYGTFLPALMAMAIRETGLQAGLLAFVLVLILTILLRIPLERLGLLHTPKLAIMMIGVIISLIFISVLSQIWEWQGFNALNSASLFPIAILTITSERIALTISEEGLKHTLSILFQTLLVTSACYIIISSVALKALVIAFPELLLGVLVLQLWIGSWTGIRVVEFYRFRSLLFDKGGKPDV